MTNVQLKGADKAIDLYRGLPAITRKAASGAVNDTLKDVQEETGQKILPDAFTLRGRGKQWWEPGQKFGFNVRPYATPQTLTGTLGSQADWLRLQEKGGTKRAEGHRVAIPADDYKPRTAIMARRLKPRSILNSTRSGAFKLASGIYRRVDGALKRLFLFEDSAQVKPVLGFEDRARKMADARFPFRFALRFGTALEKEVRR